MEHLFYAIFLMQGNYFTLYKVLMRNLKENCLIHIDSISTRQLEWPLLICSTLMFHPH